MEIIASLLVVFTSAASNLGIINQNFTPFDISIGVVHLPQMQILNLQAKNPPCDPTRCY